jgi:hypothetical protein
MNVNEQKMLDYYENVMDQVYLLYHMHPTNLPHVNLTDSEVAEMVYYDAMGRELADELAATSGQRKKKKVHLYSDRKRSNGLPRKNYY